MSHLVQPGELAVYLQHSVRIDTESMAIRVAEGWLRSVTTTLDDWPQPAPEDLWAWALELASIAYNNPQGLISRTTDEDTRAWALERKQQILDAAERKYGGARASGAGTFPAAPAGWPDPAECCVSERQ